MSSLMDSLLEKGTLITSNLTRLFEPGGLLDGSGSLWWYAKVAVGSLAVSRLFFDTYYFIQPKLYFYRLKYFLGFHRERLHLLEESTTKFCCLTTDLDLWMHMNNARYSREADFARFLLLYKTHFLLTLKKQGATFGLAATTTRFRKSINFLEMVTLHSKVVYWDERSFYIEQKFCRPSDSFVLAIFYAKMTLQRTNTQQFLEAHGFTGTRPEPPEELLSWIKFNEQSSERLRPKTS